ncbi:hypothetical protein THAOC_03091, partial [Thalassiosira oceanica]
MPNTQYTVTTVCSVCEECLQDCTCLPAPPASPPTNDDGPFMEPIHQLPDPYAIRPRKSTPASRKNDAARKKAARDNEAEAQANKRRSKDTARKRKSRGEENEAQAKRRKLERTAKDRQRRKDAKDRKAEVHKGYVQDEALELISPAGRREKEKGAGDLKFRDEKGQHYLGEMDEVCGFCKGRGWASELKTNAKDDDGDKIKNFGSLCCCKGKVQGIVDYEMPPQLLELYTGNTDEAKLFQVGFGGGRDPYSTLDFANVCSLELHNLQANARVFNNGMAMSAVRCEKNWRTRAHNNRQDSMLTAQGQLFRTIAPIVPRDGQDPKCLQTYMFGTEKATIFRMLNMKKNVREKDKVGYKDVFNKLDVILKGAGNKYLDEFIAVHDYVQKKLKGKVWDVNLSIAASAPTDGSIHRGTLNAPSCNEVAILFPEEIVGNMERQVALNRRTPNSANNWYTHTDKNSDARYLVHSHGQGDWLADQATAFRHSDHPRLPPHVRSHPVSVTFVKGQDGWHKDLDHTCVEHLNFMLMDRFDDDGNEIFNPILRGNQLGEQYIVDQFAKAETGRLRFVELHQKELCCEVYSGLNDAMKQDGGTKNVGKRVILPSSFTGGPRYQHQEYLDSMALFQRFGRPHLFLTMTCNPNWQEIKDQLKEGQTALNRPDIVARVFKMKLDQLLKDLGNECIFGKLKART